MATLDRDFSLVPSMEAVALRLTRAARALDHLHAVLSNGTANNIERSDTSEAAVDRS